MCTRKIHTSDLSILHADLQKLSEFQIEMYSDMEYTIKDHHLHAHTSKGKTEITNRIDYTTSRTHA